jgi:hypothetical protein
MSDTLISAGQVYAGASVPGAGDAGTIALTQVGAIDFNTGVSPPTISDVVITQDAAASSVSYPIPFIGDVFIQAVTIDAVHPDSVLTLTTNDLPAGVTVPAGFTLPETVIGTELDVTVQTNNGAITGTGQVGLYGVSGNLALVGVESLLLDGLSFNVGAAVLAVGGQTTGAVDESFSPLFTATCLAAGSRIRTPRGDVAVEALRAGDRVDLAEGGNAEVVWLGHRRVECRRHPKQLDVQPVRVRAGAFGTGLPERDLLLSPDHAVLTGGVLIPVRYLLNGATVSQEDVAEVTYWHVELPRHAVLLAEGLPVESYLDTGNRHAFANGGGATMIHPEFGPDAALAVWDADSCAPLVRDGAALAAVRTRLAETATALGWRLSPDPDLRLLVDGRAAGVAVAADGTLLVALPMSARRVALHSRRFVPATLDADIGDWRGLGVAVAIALNGADLPLPCFAAGFHAAEADGAWRWTDGAATLVLPVLTGPSLLTVRLLDAGGRYWLAPDEPARRAA